LADLESSAPPKKEATDNPITEKATTGAKKEQPAKKSAQQHQASSTTTVPTTTAAAGPAAKPSTSTPWGVSNTSSPSKRPLSLREIQEQEALRAKDAPAAMGPPTTSNSGDVRMGFLSLEKAHLFPIREM